MASNKIYERSGDGSVVLDVSPVISPSRHLNMIPTVAAQHGAQ